MKDIYFPHNKKDKDKFFEYLRESLKKWKCPHNKLEVWHHSYKCLDCGKWLER